MCKDCGCEDFHDHEIKIEKSLLAENDRLAHENLHWFEEHGVLALNLISSPGSGKTLLLEKTLEMISQEVKTSVIVGDQQTNNDAIRLMDKGSPIQQINTFSSCHLDARMISKELNTFVKPGTQLLFIENVGNLVCPAAFDLGEHFKIALLSTPEGEDKPIKYPVLFHNANLILITKMDLVPHLDWSLEKCTSFIRQVNNEAPIIPLSAKTGEGMLSWKMHLLEMLRHRPEHHHHHEEPRG